MRDKLRQRRRSFIHGGRWRTSNEDPSSSAEIQYCTNIRKLPWEQEMRTSCPSQLPTHRTEGNSRDTARMLNGSGTSRRRPRAERIHQRSAYNHSTHTLLCTHCLLQHPLGSMLVAGSDRAGHFSCRRLRIPTSCGHLVVTALTQTWTLAVLAVRVLVCRRAGFRILIHSSTLHPTSSFSSNSLANSHFALATSYFRKARKSSASERRDGAFVSSYVRRASRSEEAPYTKKLSQRYMAPWPGSVNASYICKCGDSTEY